MLRIFFMAVIVSTEVMAVYHYPFVQTVSYIPTSEPNQYFAIRVDNSGEERVRYLDILQEITRKQGLELSIEWVYDTSGWGGGGPPPDNGDAGPPVIPRINTTISGPMVQNFCCALDRLAESDAGPPRPDDVLGLRGLRCPLKKGSIVLPSDYRLPESMDSDYKMDCDYVDYLVKILGKNSSPKQPKTYVTSTLVFIPCHTITG